MRIALLANPDSGGGEADDAQRLLGEQGAQVSRFGLDQLDAAIAAAPERIVVAGGDGSVGCGAAAASRADVPLAVIPVGTANDFARGLGIPVDAGAAAELAVGGRRTRRLDLGRFGERPFVNAASAGLSPVAARKAHGLKRVLGPLAYAVGALRAGFAAKPIWSRVRCDGDEVFAGRAWQLTVALTGAFGGGAEVDADPHDGVLDVVVIEAGSRTRLIGHAYGLRAGRVEGQANVSTAAGREVEVETRGEGGFNVDGELIAAGSARIAVEPGAFELVSG